MCALARTCLFPRLERREKVEMGACASVHKDPGHPKKQFLDSPTKAKAANGKGGGGGGVAPVGDGFGDLKSKVDAEAEQLRAEFNPKNPDSGMRVCFFGLFLKRCSDLYLPIISYCSFLKFFGGKEQMGSQLFM